MVGQPHMTLPKQGTLLPQVPMENAVAKGLAMCKTDSSLVIRSLESDGASNLECLELQQIGARRESEVSGESRKARKRRCKRKDKGMSSTRRTLKLQSANAQKHSQKCLRRELRLRYDSRRMQIQFKANLFKLREISSTERVSKPLARQASFRSG